VPGVSGCDVDGPDVHQSSRTREPVTRRTRARVSSWPEDAWREEGRLPARKECEDLSTRVGRRLTTGMADAGQMVSRNRHPSSCDVLPRRRVRRGRLRRPPKRSDARCAAAPGQAGRFLAGPFVNRHTTGLQGTAARVIRLLARMAAVVAPSAARTAGALFPPIRRTSQGRLQGGGCSRRRPQAGERRSNPERSAGPPGRPGE